CLTCFALLGVLAFARGEQPKSEPSKDDLARARQVGWQAALMVVEQFESKKVPGFPGIEAWVSDFRKQTKGLDPSADPAKWPKVDVNALSTHNPHFWRAYYEIAPGDPGLTFLYAGVLLGGGEAARARLVLEFGNLRPGIPKTAQASLEGLYAAAKWA